LSVKLNLTPELLKTLYIDKELSTREIAELLGISHSTISKYLSKWNIPTRDYSTARRLRDSKRQIKIEKAEVEEIKKMIKEPSKIALEEFISAIDEIPEVKYIPTKHEDISISLPLSLVGKRKKEDIVLTLVFSDLHLGDSDFLPGTYYSCVENVKRVLTVLNDKFNIVRFNMIGNGDLVSGREVYRYQVLRNLLPRGHWQVFVSEKILKELIDEINKILPVSSVFLCKGTHESLTENYLLYLKKALLSLGINTHYISHAKVLNIAEPLGKYNVLFTHGYGKSSYYPISYAMIRDLWKSISQYKARDIRIERVCLGHTHWLTTSLVLEGLLVDVSGGFQRWEYTISQRPCGMILYLYCNNEVSAIPIRPDKDVESKEKADSALEYKNLRFYGQKLLSHFKEIEMKNYGKEV